MAQQKKKDNSKKEQSKKKIVTKKEEKDLKKAVKKENPKKIRDDKKKIKKDNKKAKEASEFFEEKPRREKTLSYRIVNTILWIVLIVWMGICLIDFYNVHKENDPIFCLTKDTTKYKDGKVDSCLGLGYKVIQYNRDSYKGIEYGPFWSKDRSAKK